MGWFARVLCRLASKRKSFRLAFEEGFAEGRESSFAEGNELGLVEGNELGLEGLRNFADIYRRLLLLSAGFQCLFAWLLAWGSCLYFRPTLQAIEWKNLAVEFHFERYWKMKFACRSYVGLVGFVVGFLRSSFLLLELCLAWKNWFCLLGRRVGWWMEVIKMCWFGKRKRIGVLVALLEFIVLVVWILNFRLFGCFRRFVVVIVIIRLLYLQK